MGDWKPWLYANQDDFRSCAKCTVRQPKEDFWEYKSGESAPTLYICKDGVKCNRWRLAVSKIMALESIHE